MDMQYWRLLITEMPKALVVASKRFGWKGAYLVGCAFIFKRVPFAVKLHPFIEIKAWHEAVNYVDNFILDELRIPELEEHLKSSQGEVIEVGVNIGITSRWWLTLNPDIRVIGIDMMQEALDFTKNRIAELGQAHRWQSVVGAVGDHTGTNVMKFNDPLEGTNSLNTEEGSQERPIETNTLDTYLKRAKWQNPLLLKIDIEGHAAAALRGAAELLKQVHWVVIETHHRNELVESADLLTASAYHLFHIHGRTMTWVKKEIR
jgi:FkbM family methyltransferase